MATKITGPVTEMRFDEYSQGFGEEIVDKLMGYVVESPFEVLKAMYLTHNINYVASSDPKNSRVSIPPEGYKDGLGLEECVDAGYGTVITGTIKDLTPQLRKYRHLWNEDNEALNKLEIATEECKTDAKRKWAYYGLKKALYELKSQKPA